MPLLSETSEVTTVRAAIRTIAGYQLQMSRLTYPYRPTAARAVAQPPQGSVYRWKCGYAT
jgi:hypothetical protein